MAQSILATDGYKFSMAAAGFPLRQETFYYSHRKGGPHYLPFDVESEIRKMLPPHSCEGDSYLRSQGYHMGGAFWEAMRGEIKVRALPKGSWFFDREPVFTVTGPSALVSWLEPLVLQLHYRIQVATLAKRLVQKEWEDHFKVVSTERQREIILETFAQVDKALPFDIQVNPEPYMDHVRERVAGLVEVVKDPARIFEVGMRAATCMEQHRLALTAAGEAGLQATSNVLLAQEMGLKAVGTMGHEHVQRFGNDEDAFRAMRDRHPGPTSFLLDTFSTIHSGLPTAFRLIQEDPSRGDTVRFDSGDKKTQFLIACSMAKSMGIKPRFILEDGFTEDMTREFEVLRDMMGIPPEDVMYGYGGYIVKAPGDTLTRDNVAAVWKVTQSGSKPTMKFGDEPGSGKESIPGEPILYRYYDKSRSAWLGYVAQEGEDVKSPQVTDKDIPMRVSEAVFTQMLQGAKPLYSPETKKIVKVLTKARNRFLEGE